MLAKLMESALRICTKIIAEGGENMPTWVIKYTHPKTGIPAFEVAVTPWSDAKEKALYDVKIRERLQELNADCIVFSSEAWAIDVSQDTPRSVLDNIVPSEDDRRIEVLMINGEGRDGTKLFRQFKIKRSGNSVPELVELPVVSSEVTGRFVNMFEPITKVRH